MVDAGCSFLYLNFYCSHFVGLLKYLSSPSTVAITLTWVSSKSKPNLLQFSLEEIQEIIIQKRVKGDWIQPQVGDDTKAMFIYSKCETHPANAFNDQQ